MTAGDLRSAPRVRAHRIGCGLSMRRGVRRVPKSEICFSAASSYHGVEPGDTLSLQRRNMPRLPCDVSERVVRRFGERRGRRFARASFLQMAESFPLETLVVAGMELCGRYAVSREGAISSRCPLTSASRLRRFVGQAEGMRGVKKARRALRFVMDDSASPMETSLALLLSMPRSLGGYGLPRPVMNLRIDAVAFDKCMVGHCAESRFFRGDLCWP